MTCFVKLRPARRLTKSAVFDHSPCGFLRIPRKRQRYAALFSPSLSPSFQQLVCKFQFWAMQGQVTRSGQWPHYAKKNFTIVPKLVFERMLWNLWNMIRSSVPTKRIFRIFDICDLRSDHCRDLPVISQWAKIELPVLCFIWSLYEWNRII